MTDIILSGRSTSQGPVRWKEQVISQVSSGQVYGAVTVCGKREVASQVKGPAVIDIDQVARWSLRQWPEVKGLVAKWMI